jgi:hypothetical protein
MIISLIIISFLLLSSVGLNFWLILYTIPWKNSTIDHFVRKFRQQFEFRWNELTDEEKLETHRLYISTNPHPKKSGPVTLNKPK